MDADEVMTSYMAAWQRGDPEAAFEHYADDVVMRLPGRTALAGEHHGKAAVVAAIRALLARTDEGDVVVETIDRVTSGERVGIVLRERVRRGDEALDIRRVNLYQVRDGRIHEIDIYEGDQYAVDAFFGTS
jgi:ketosteroid isomerase-like protein